ncbi:hypothetical protein JNUCC0626_08355 [Lentzea sp. JNUCC 0626]|uniref:hypothetical protein n=1 Tax=Lentzea sp. JNUCC 0626 TaxID=3367513 RepID=UPI003748F0B6
MLTIHGSQHASQAPANAQRYGTDVRYRWSTNSRAELPICTALAQDAADAKNFVAIPDPPAQAAWAKTLPDALRSGDGCQRALKQRDAPLFSKSLSDSLSAVNSYATLQRRITSMAEGR